MIVTAALIESALEETILTRMVPLTEDERNDLFTGYAPLTSLSTKIRFAYAFGLIGRKTRTDLNKIREIRNAFSHAKHKISFQTKEVADLCISLEFSKRVPEVALKLRPGNRLLYFTSAGFIWLYLKALISNPKQSNPVLD